MIKNNIGYLLVAIAATFWGICSIIVRMLLNYQLSVQTIVIWRIISAFIILFPVVFFTNRKLLKIDRNGLICIALTGIIIHFVGTFLHYSAIQKTSVAIAGSLLYTSPIFITIMARIFYKEAFSSLKSLALFFCILGCFFAVSGGSFDTFKLNLIGVLMGLGAGFSSALLTILGKSIIKNYHQLTILVYSLGSGLLFGLPFSHPLEIFKTVLALKVWILLFSFGLISTVLAYGIHITGLSYGIEASKAGIILSLELVVSVVLSSLIFKEALWGLKLIGILMVLFSAITVQVSNILSHRSSLS